MDFRDHLVKVQAVGIIRNNSWSASSRASIMALIPPFKTGVYVKHSSVDMVFFQHCNPCPAFNFGQCPGGYKQIKDGKCPLKVKLNESSSLIEVTLAPHAYVLGGGERSLFLISLDPKPKGNMSEDLRLTPYFTGHVHSNGQICTGTVKTNAKVPVFSSDYLKIWAALHSGHIWPNQNLKSNFSLEVLLKSMSLPFLKEQALKYGFSPQIEKPLGAYMRDAELCLAGFEDCWIETLYRIDGRGASIDRDNFFADLALGVSHFRDYYFVENSQQEVYCFNNFSAHSECRGKLTVAEKPAAEKVKVSSADFKELLTKYGEYTGGIE